ncbi:MAG: DUF1499 domain-containing protein [Nitratireductor sp.]|nr:DUF1499 domain-containing protein [Nitratireductor sp.]
MTGFYERQESSAAKWCLRLAVISAPFLLLSILMHRAGSVTTFQAFWLIAVGIAMIVTGLLFGMKAAFELWEKGYKGGRATVNGIVLGILLLLPFGVQFLNAIEHPKLNDVATDVVTAPRFLTGPGVQDGAAPVYDEFFAREIVANYPELVGRRYDAPPERVAVAVVELLKNWGWRRVAERNLPAQAGEGAEAVPAAPSDPESEEGAAEPAPAQDENLAGDDEELNQLRIANGDAPTTLPDILIEAEARSLIMKLPSHQIIRLRDDNGSTIVDMRSASDWGPHDFGSNAGNITAFLSALDTALAGLAGE